VLRLWEALHPVPAGGRFSEEALVDQARTWLARLYQLAPEVRVVHGATAEGPEECDALLQNEFTSQHFEDMVQAEPYSRWLDHAPLSRQYASLALQLAVLDAGGDGRRGRQLHAGVGRQPSNDEVDGTGAQPPSPPGQPQCVGGTGLRALLGQGLKLLRSGCRPVVEGRPAGAV
jgi:hypothetical protein